MQSYAEMTTSAKQGNFEIFQKYVFFNSATRAYLHTKFIVKASWQYQCVLPTYSNFLNTLVRHCEEMKALLILTQHLVHRKATKRPRTHMQTHQGYANMHERGDAR